MDKKIGAIDQLKKAFPDTQIMPLNKGAGANLYFEKTTISIWFKKQKYGNDAGWYRYRDLEHFIAEMDKYINPQPKVAHIEPEPVQTGNRVQEVIDHILNKREVIMKQQPDNKLAAFCLTLTDELKQYL